MQSLARRRPTAPGGRHRPAKVFDDLYFVGTKGPRRSAWVLPTSEGIILIDTSFEYEGPMR